MIQNQDRMQWVDAMRGFSMIIVVLGHVLLSMGLGGYDSFLSSVLLTFRMPLFFFVSGFFSYRVISWWNRKRINDILKRKVQAQILCTLAFLFVYQIVTGGGISLRHGFGGYWFTIVLFQMYVIYLTLSVLSRFLRFNIVIPVMLLISAMFVGIIAFNRGSSWIWEFLCWENLTKYFQFFTVGIVCSKYRDKFFKLLCNNTFITVMIIGWVISMLLWYNDSFRLSQPFLYSIVHDIFVRYFALMTVVIVFYSNSSVLSGNSSTSRLLRFIGRRTLDIYMIHYFLIPNLGFMKAWLENGNMVIIQFAISALVTAVIVLICLMLSSIIRKSSTLESWLFGVRQRKLA